MFGFLKKKETIEISVPKSEPDIKEKTETTLEIDKGIAHPPTEEFDANEKLIPTLTDLDSDKGKSAKELELESQIGKLLICISDQYENPRVCVGVEVVHITKNNIPMLSVYDIVKKEKSIPWGCVFDYTEQKFDALNQMDPNARIALFFNRLGGDLINKKPTEEHPYVQPNEWKKEVMASIDRINKGIWT